MCIYIYEASHHINIGNSNSNVHIIYCMYVHFFLLLLHVQHKYLQDTTNVDVDVTIVFAMFFSSPLFHTS